MHKINVKTCEVIYEMFHILNCGFECKDTCLCLFGQVTVTYEVVKYSRFRNQIYAIWHRQAISFSSAFFFCMNSHICLLNFPFFCVC